MQYDKFMTLYDLLNCLQLYKIIGNERRPKRLIYCGKIYLQANKIPNLLLLNFGL